MKKIFTLVCFLIFAGLVYAQQASDYFPDQTGFYWDYRVTPLDSLNNEIDSLIFARKDTFSIVGNYQGRLANIVPTKSAPLQTINLQSYEDTLFYHLDDTNGFEFFDLGPLEVILAQLDSLGIDTTFSFLDFFKSLEDWYPTYRFASAINSVDTLVSRDTVINTPIGGFTFRFEYFSTRLQDEALQTAIGNFNCKKFFLKWKVSVLLLPPPLPPTEVISTKDTIWIAPDYWIVQDIIPTNHIDLSFFGVDPFSIPGLKTEIEAVTNIEEEFAPPEAFYLSQNFPNPFNPSTKIKFRISSASGGGFVNLKVYDVLGNEIATLVSENKPAGTYEVNWNAENIPSGVYFYKLTAGNLIETKKMLLLK